MSKICVIAHDRMKPDLVRFLHERSEWMWGRKFLATGLTAEFLHQQQPDLDIEDLPAGREGGFIELTRRIQQGEISLVIFFRDPEIVQDYEAEIVAFVKECIRKNIPLASNRASAELLIVGMIRMEASRKK
ncbi:MAG: methylglyoxal synthase [Flavobacteriales bacterium]